MRYIIFRKADADTEAGVMPGQDLLEAMGRYNEELVAQGWFVDGMGLRPSRDGARVVFEGGEPTVTDGPFAETKELIAGFTILRADSLDEATAIARRWPPVDGGGNASLEIRRVYEVEDFAPGAGLEVHRDLHERLERQPALMNPYVAFRGQCREAFAEYADCLGGHVETLVTFGQSPLVDETPAGRHDLVLHARLRVGNWVLMGGDMADDCYEAPRGFSVHIAVDDPARAATAFDRLADGGTVRMPFAETFWAERFGMLVDRFGIPWIINCGIRNP